MALARAIYGKFDTYVLDDVLSALDATTEAQVFSALFGVQGLLKGKAVIMATNQVYRLPQASYITYLQDGEIAEQGSYEDLMAKDGLLSTLISEFSTAKKGSGQAREVEEKPVNDALTESAQVDTRSEKDEQGEVSAKGGVAWSTYGLYLKGMGTTHAVICESDLFSLCTAAPVVTRYLLMRIRVFNDCRDPGHRDLHPSVPSSVDDDSQRRLAAFALWCLPRRIHRNAARLPVLLLRRHLQCLPIRPSDR